VHFPPEKEARLRQLATRTDKEAAQVIEEAVDQLLDYNARFVHAVAVGRTEARRGKLIEHEEVVQRTERMFRP
jgi:predicted transcriptional regulator